MRGYYNLVTIFKQKGNLTEVTFWLPLVLKVTFWDMP